MKSPSRRRSRPARAGRSIGCWRLAEPLGLEEVRHALAEDAAAGDITTSLLGSAAAAPVTGRFIAGGAFVVAGLPVVATVLQELEAGSCLDVAAAEGSRVRDGDVLAVATASARTLLAGERVALNFLQRLSGIATATRRAVDVFWKDNHWTLLGRTGRSLRDVLAAAPRDLPVVVEVETDTQLEAALAAGVTHILADNQPPERVAAWVRRAGSGVTIQASGGITEANAAA